MSRETLCVPSVGKHFEGKIGSWPNETGAFFFLSGRVFVCGCHIPITSTSHPSFSSEHDLVLQPDISSHFPSVPRGRLFPCPLTRDREWQGQGLQQRLFVSSPVLHLKLQTLGGAGYLLVACGCTVSSVFTGNSTRLARGRAHFPTATIGFPALCIKD